MTSQQRTDFESALSKWAFPGLLSLVMGFITMQTNGISSDIGDLKEKMEQVQKDQAVMISRNHFADETHKAQEAWLEDLEKRVQALERGR